MTPRDRAVGRLVIALLCGALAGIAAGHWPRNSWELLIGLVAFIAALCAATR